MFIHEPKYIRNIQQRCGQKGLNPISLQGSSFGGEGNTGLIKNISHKLVLMHGCKTLGCHIIKYTGARRGTSGGIQSVIEVCKELAPAAEEMGMLIALENHADNVLERSEDYEQIFSAIDSPNVGLCLESTPFDPASVEPRLSGYGAPFSPR